MTSAVTPAAAAVAAPGRCNPTADPANARRGRRRIAAAGVPTQRNRPLAPDTTFGIGGPAALYVEAVEPAALAAVLAALAGTDETAVPLLVVGRGSNLLIADTGFPGVVVRLGRGFSWLRREGTLVSAGAATAMPALAAWAATEGLAGLEFAARHSRQRRRRGADERRRARRRTRRRARRGRPRPAGLGRFGRGPAGPARLRLPSIGAAPRSVVTAARLRLRPDDPPAIRARLDALRAWRRAAQPLRQRNCGSVFTNPDGDSAGRLIEAAGLKGLRVGRAQVSERHANFIVVEPGSRAVDVLALIVEVRRRVAAAGGPRLRPEVRLVGDFGPDLAADLDSDVSW